mmetsp:Transcript_38987/g.103293  ORF Transcript_38987/g.103293 Transcript_38987/m.103293 type:complete len:205 (+) Transcript_38987:534-1148(+)
MPTPSQLRHLPEPCTMAPRMFWAQPPHSGHPCSARPKSIMASRLTEGARNMVKYEPLPPQLRHLPEPVHVVQVLGCLASHSACSSCSFRRLSSSSRLSLSSCARRSLRLFSSLARWRCWSSSCCFRRTASRSSALLFLSASRPSRSRRCLSASARSRAHCSFALLCLQRPLPPSRSVWVTGWQAVLAARRSLGSGPRRRRSWLH